MADEERTYPPDDVVLRAGRACFDWVRDMGDCLFCSYATNTDAHEEWCPLVTPPSTPVGGGEGKP